jgi:hypothetical protein
VRVHGREQALHQTLLVLPEGGDLSGLRSDNIIKSAETIRYTFLLIWLRNYHLNRLQGSFIHGWDSATAMFIQINQLTQQVHEVVIRNPMDCF